MQYVPAEHAELTPQHYENLMATGYRYMEFMGYLEVEDPVGLILVLYKPIRLKTDGQDLLSIDAPVIKNLVYNNPSMAIFIEKNY